MDDNLKIRVLMTYFGHWGNEQNDIRKAIHGAKKFQKILNNNGFLLNTQCRTYLKRHNRRFQYELMDILLNECGGGFRPNDMMPEPWDRTEVLVGRFLPFIEQHDIYDTYYDIFDHHFTSDNALSVDAIIALL
jgi:hypothetical protein